MAWVFIQFRGPGMSDSAIIAMRSALLHHMNRRLVVGRLWKRKTLSSRRPPFALDNKGLVLHAFGDFFAKAFQSTAPVLSLFRGHNYFFHSGFWVRSPHRAPPASLCTQQEASTQRIAGRWCPGLRLGRREDALTSFPPAISVLGATYVSLTGPSPIAHRPNTTTPSPFHVAISSHIDTNNPCGTLLP